MSRTTAGIMRINQELDKISGLDGIVSDRIEELEKHIKAMISDILENHPDANMFDYYGDGSNMLSSSAKYDASLRIKEIEKVIRNIQKDGLKVALNEGKLYVENTVRTMTTDDYTEPFGYSEIDCLGDYKVMPDMREKVKEYISEIQEEIDRLVQIIENKFVELGNDAAKEVYLNGIEYAKIESRIQTLTEVQNDLKNRLKEEIS